MTIYLYPYERVRVALAYDSNPSSDYTSDPLEGDLDLYLLGPSLNLVAISAGIDSWEIIEYTPTTEGLYTVVIHNFFGSLSDSEQTFAGVAVWPGHYVLQPYVPQVRDEPPGAWNRDSGDDYRFTTREFWNAVGLRPPSDADYDLFLFNNSVYGDPADHLWLEDSTIGGSAVDIVVIDGNHASSGAYYATVSAYSGSGNYSIEHATWTEDLVEGTYGPYTMGPSQVLRIWDAHLASGVRKYFAVRPVLGDADLGVALFDSDPNDAATWYQGFSTAVSVADANGAGGSEYLDYQTSTDDWMGLVVWNNGAALNTTFYVYVDTSPPTGSIFINGGATYATSASVVLELSANDPQTGVLEMRFSNDGATWSNWEPYATTKSWLLPGGDGVKTVYAQFRNRVGLVSNTYFDSIVLDTTPPSSSAFSPSTTGRLSFVVTWSGTDNLSGVASYDVQYRVGDSGGWMNWFSGTSATSASFGPTNPVTTERGQVYYFRVRARDNAGNVEAYPAGSRDTNTRVLWVTYLPATRK